MFDRREFLAGASSVAAAVALHGPLAARPACRPALLPLLDGTAARLLAHQHEMAVYAGAPSALGGSAAQSRFDDYSPAGEARLRAVIAEERTRLIDVDCIAGSREALQLAVARATLDSAHDTGSRFAWGHVQPFWFSGHVPYVASQISGPHIDGPGWMIAQQSVKSAAEGEAYVTKIADSRRMVDGLVTKIEADAALGCVPPALLMDKAAAGLAAFLSPEPAAHPLVNALADKLAAAQIDADVAAKLKAGAARATERSLYPAFARLRETLVASARRGRAATGVWALPEGDAYYAAQVRLLGDTARTPDEVHQLGLEEVRRISAAMESRLARLGMTRGSVGERMAALAADDAHRYADSAAGREQLLADLRAMITRAQALQPRYLSANTIPPQAVEVRAVPKAAEATAPGGFYDGPSIDGTRPGIYWINLRDMNAVVKWRLPTLTYHEAVPGHHLQGAVALNQGATPLLLKLASFNAYQEGWALYAEQLMAEFDAYADDPLGDLGRLQDELFRAVRLATDTGLHWKRWSREQAQAYMRETTGVPDTRVEAEVDRYLAWPGQALGYKLGQIRINELRDAARRHARQRFTLAAFHDAVLLGGAMPLALVEAQLRARRLLPAKK